MTVRRSFRASGLLLALLAAGCGEPPNKEMDQAQGAIDAARAAGADEYAETEYVAATEALKNAQLAVGARDYRLALNHALESREHAQNAARDGAEAKARVRAEVERMTTDITALLATARARMANRTAPRAPAGVLRDVAADVAVAEAAVQKSGEAVASGDYLAASAVLTGVREKLAAAMAALNPAPTAARRRS